MEKRADRARRNGIQRGRAPFVEVFLSTSPSTLGDAEDADQHVPAITPSVDVAVVGGCPVESRLLAERLRPCGQRVEVVPLSALLIPEARRPRLVIVELGLRSPRELMFLPRHIRERWPGVKVLAQSREPSVALAVQAHRAAFDAFETAPCGPEVALALLGAQARPEDAGPGQDCRREPYSLSRARWEYISRTILETSSLAQAARQMGLDRRSLRRMLSKNPALR